MWRGGGGGAGGREGGRERGGRGGGLDENLTGSSAPGYINVH